MMVPIIRRHRIEIINEMLVATKEGAGIRKTRMFFTSNLNYTMGSKYLGELLERGLVEVENRCFFITEKGESWIRRFKELKK